MRGTAVLHAERRAQPVERRRTVLDGDPGRAEVLAVEGLTRARMPCVHSGEFQVLFPLAGVFNWHLGSTDVFRRSEGIPIARYHRRLRLTRALAELPHTDDITALALRFGFSSHAHFCSAFRREFGRTPSDYRARMRRRDLRSLLARASRTST